MIVTKCFFRIALLLALVSISWNALSQITANGNSGQTTTSYTSSAANVPIFVWCATSTAPTPGSLTATPTNAGTYTFQWYRHNAPTSSWVTYTNTIGTTSTINNLTNGGYRVEVKNGNTVVECFHVWVWNLLGNASISKTGNCSNINLTANVAVNDTFTYYNPPPPQSIISASTQISVCFNATHTWVSDLGFYLVGPSSCGSPTVILSPSPNNICNGNNNVSNLCFSSTSTANFNVCATNIPNPLSGTYGTYGTTSTPINWAALYGCNAAQGGWKVQIYDCEALDVGALTNATITFSNLPSTCGGPTTVTYNSGTINSAINDNSCNAAAASVYTVPPATVITSPIKTFATRSFAWSSSSSGVNLSNPSAVSTTATAPVGSSTIDLVATYTIGNTSCTFLATSNHFNSTSTNTVNTQTICQGQSYSFNGINYTTNNSTAKDTLTTTLGCDSIVTLNLTVTPYLTGTRNINICQGQSYTFNGITYTTNNNTAKDTTQSAAGCDSIITLNLTVTPYLIGIRNINICQGQSYTFNGITYTANNNTAKDTTQSAAGCDSIITLNLTVTPYLTGARNVNICQGQSYTFNGISYTTNNNSAKDTVSSATTCDSIITLNLTVSPYIQGTRNVNICQGQSYTFNGVSYTANNNTAKDTVSSLITCDSIITLNLTVTPYIQGTRNVNICQGQSYTFNGVSYTTNNNSAKDTISSPTTCDSIITLNLTINAYNSRTINASICQGQSYSFNGNIYTTSVSNLKDTVLSMMGGCDTIITLNLTVTPYLTGTEAVTICQGQSYIFNGVTYTSSNNNAKDTVQNLSGCDSIVTLNLTVNPYLIGTRTINICYGESYTFNGVTYTTSNNTAKDTIPSPTGCDSIITLNLTVAPFLTGIRTVVLCAGDSYTFNGVTYTTSNNTATDTIQNSSGCDSLVTLDLTILPPLSSIDRRNICFGESYLFNGSTYTTSNNTARDTFISTNGCDSIVTLNLSVSSPVNFLTIDTSGCGSITIDGTTYTTSIFVNDTIRGIAGCDSLYINYNILIYPNYNLRTNIDSVSCDSVLFEGTTYYADTSFVQMFNTVNGCDSLQRTVNIDIDDFELDLNADLLQPYEGEVITLTATTNIPYYQVISWEPSSLFLDQQAKAQWVKLYENTQITVTAISPNGCIDTASLDFNTLDITHTVSFPNAFTPNGDGRNDIFKPLVAIKRAYLVKYFRIVNRWGQEVFHQISQNVEGWDGTFKGVPQGMGVYNYYFEIEFVDGKKIQMKGDVTLVR